MEEELHFSVDSALLKELGEKLVETVHLALSELVKNSYDADASYVKIIFGENDRGESRITIIDDGHGMNFEEVQNYWMRIATTHKMKKNHSTQFGRPLTGAKGIGRFSCRRLGGELTLVSIGRVTIDGINKLERTEVNFPWTKFESGADVTTITCKGSKSYIDDAITGTTLIIDDISDEWGTRGINWLKRQLGRLTANRGAKRIGFKEDPGFNVFIQGSEDDSEIKNLRNELIHAGWGTLTAKIDKNNQAFCTLDAMGLGKRTITSKQKFNHLKDVKLELGIMMPEAKRIRDKSIISLGNLSYILRDWGGVQVQYRGFRVSPYGNDDWLNIDKDRGLRKAKPKEELFQFAQNLKGIDSSRALLNMLGMRNYVGQVKIGEKATGFEMKLNREGFLDSAAMRELKEFVRFAIDWSTIMRDYSLRLEEEKAYQDAKLELEKTISKTTEGTEESAVTSAVNLIESNFKTLTSSLDVKKRRGIEQEVAKATEVLKNQERATQSQLNHMRLIASTSTLLLVFQHEVKTLLGLLEQNKNSLNRISEKLDKEDREEINEISSGFKILNTRLGELLQMTSLMATDHSKAKRGQIALKSRLKKIDQIFELITNKYKIDIDHSQVASSIVIKNILEAEVYSVLLNVISNSIKAVIAKSSNGKIKIIAHRTSDYLELVIRDNGIGIQKNRFQEVFIPFVSDPEGKLYKNLEKKLNPEDNMIVGTGSGLGLGIVKEIISANNGQVYFQAPTEEGWSSELIIRFK